MLVEPARVAAGQKILIHAGSGGVGVMAIQLAKHLGATVATTAGPSNQALVKDLGADVSIDYRAERFETMLEGYDVALNTLDSKTLEKSLVVLAPGGLLISLSGPPDPEFAQKQGLNPMLGFVMRLLSLGIRRKARKRDVRYAFHFMHASGEQLEQLTPLIEDGTIRPLVDRVFPFSASTTRSIMSKLGTPRAKSYSEWSSDYSGFESRSGASTGIRRLLASRWNLAASAAERTGDYSRQSTKPMIYRTFGRIHFNILKSSDS